ncbi:MAG TPA: Ig-like domain-containing protein [Candidatus Solibacter sp.]|jgi:hypothetical protein|nr:Ig-like domain-containing protein [Candidatus Solibacter sp.]
MIPRPGANRRLSALAALPLLLLALPACAPSAPAIEDVSPHKGDGGVAGDAPIKITFDRAMDHESVSTRFQLSPAIEGCSVSRCPVTWKDRTMVFSHPAYEFQPDTKYTVRLRPGYRDTSGHANDIEHSWEFHTDTAPSLQSANPPAGAKGVAPDIDITLQFSRAMQVPRQQQLKLVDSESDAAAAVPARVTLDPADASRLVVSPLTLLASRHRYRLLVTPDYQDTRHNDIGREINLGFTTGDADLSRSLAFTVLDGSGASGHRIAVLRPPASLGAPAPSIHVVYKSTAAILDFGWAPDAQHIYTLEGSPASVVRVSIADGVAQPLGIQASSIAVSPAHDEIAYVATDHSLHLWAPPTATGASPTDINVAEAGPQAGAPSWSGDGRRLALVVPSTAGEGLAVLERSTLSRFVVPGVTLSSDGLDAGPRWSVDGTAVAFERDLSGSSAVWAYRPLAASGMEMTRIGAMTGASLAWSSDGSTIYAAGESSAGGPRLLSRAPAAPVDGQTGGFARLQSSIRGDDMPATPSFDRRLAFLRAAAKVPQLWLVNGDGSGLVQLTFEKYSQAEMLMAFGVGLPRWAPSGLS